MYAFKLQSTMFITVVSTGEFTRASCLDHSRYMPTAFLSTHEACTPCRNLVTIAKMWAGHVMPVTVYE
jgi:hypothetical protein